MGTLKAVDDALFAQLERLNNPSLAGDKLKDEIRRATAIVSVTDQITDTARVKLDAAKLYGTFGAQVLDMLPQISGPKDG